MIFDLSSSCHKLYTAFVQLLASNFQGSETVQNAAGVFKEDKDLAGLMAVTASVYEASAYILGSNPSTPLDPRRTINMADKWGRIEIARLCAAAVYADWTSTQDFVKRVGAPFWKMLCLLATR